MSTLIKFKNMEEVSAYAAENSRLLLMYDDYVLDATTFATHHPGGAGLIKNYQTKNVAAEMKGHFPLSLVMANSLTIGTLSKDLDKLIDNNRAMVQQIWNLDHEKYLRIIDSPQWLFVPSPRMFTSNFFQMLSHNKWYHIPYIPIAIVTYMLYLADWTLSANPFTLLLILLSGILTFSLFEYLLHRFVFHSEGYLPDNKLIRYLHFILHGIHHMLPSDPDRLVFPPALTILLSYILLTAYFKFVNLGNPQYDAMFITGFLIGYLIYDIIHYMLHHVDTSKSKGGYFHRLQQYHNQHHFSGETAGYGVSSKLWDIIFRTQLTSKQKHK